MINQIQYNITAPHHYLKEFIICYWHFKINPTETTPFDILPDGYFDLIISFRDNQIIDVQLTGIWNKLITVFYDEQIEIFGVRFKPIAMENLFDLNISNIINDATNIELKDLKLNKQRIIDDFSVSNQNIIDYLNTHFISLLQKSQININTKVIFDLIDGSSGTQQIADISNTIGVSTRHIHRTVKNITGVSAKDYSQIVRFRENVEILKLHKNDYVGYYDQSHFIKDFKRFTGCTPNNLNICNDVRFLQYFDYIKH